MVEPDRRVNGKPLSVQRLESGQRVRTSQGAPRAAAVATAHALPSWRWYLLCQRPAMSQDPMGVSPIQTGASIVVALLILRSGLLNTLLVIAGVALALCHPLVRTFLEIPDAQEAPVPEAPVPHAPKPRSHDTPRRSLSSLPPVLRPKVKQIISYATRDFVQYWYDPISFGDLSFPDACSVAMEHAAGTVSDAFSHYTRTEVATQLLLTGCHTVSAALRQRKRSQETGRSIVGLWADDNARIETLRMAIGAFLQRILPSDDCASPAFSTLLTELVTKQAWCILTSHSDPNTINNIIVKFGDRGFGGVAAAVALGGPAAELAEGGNAPRPPQDTVPGVSKPERPQDTQQLDAAQKAQPQRGKQPATQQSSAARTSGSSVPPAGLPALSQARALFSEPLSSVANSWKEPEKHESKHSEPPALPMDVPRAFEEPPLHPNLQKSQLGETRPELQRRGSLPLETVLQDRTSDEYAAFESYLQGSPDGSLEGLVLLQLYANLQAVGDAYQGSDPELFASDASAVLETAAFMLEDVPNKKVRTAISAVLKRPLRSSKDLGAVKDAINARLSKMYNEYRMTTGTLAYEPRRPSSANSRAKSPSAGMSAPRCVSVLDVSNNADSSDTVDLRTFEMLITLEDANATDTDRSGYVVIRRWHQLESLHAELTRLYAQRPDDSILQHAPPRLPAVRGKTSAEACAAVESYLGGLLSPPPEDTAGMIYASAQAVHRFIDKTRADEPAALARRQVNLMSSIGGMGRSFASGVAGAAGSARKGLGQIATPTPLWNSANVSYAPRREKPKPPSRPSSAGDGPPVLPPRSSSVPQDTSEPTKLNRTEEAPSSAHAGTVSASSSPTKATAELPAVPTDAHAPPRPNTDAKQAASTDALVRAVFSVAYEAFDLQGAWTMRRGVLRVLEQVVRTTYASTAASSVSYMASSLSEESLVSWCDTLSDSLWPGGVWSTEPSPTPTAEERTRNAAKAREVMVEYAPTQALALGLGGRQLCVDAIASVHSVITDKTIARDLQLAILLRALDMGIVAST